MLVDATPVQVISFNQEDMTGGGGGRDGKMRRRLRSLPSNFRELTAPLYEYRLDEVSTFKETRNNNSNPVAELARVMPLLPEYKVYVKPKVGHHSITNVMESQLQSFACDAYIVGAMRGNPMDPNPQVQQFFMLNYS